MMLRSRYSVSLMVRSSAANASRKPESTCSTKKLRLAAAASRPSAATVELSCRSTPLRSETGSPALMSTSVFRSRIGARLRMMASMPARLRSDWISAFRPMLTAVALTASSQAVLLASHRPAFARKHLLDRHRVERVDVEGLREADVLVQAFRPERRGAADDLRGGRAGGRVVARRGHRRPRPGKRDEPDAILGLEAIDESAGRFHGAARVEIPEAALIDGQEDEPSIGSRRRDPLVRAERRDDGPRLDRLRRGWSVERRELHELGRDDPPRLPVDGDLELLRPQVRDRVPVLVHDGDINRDELDAGLEDGLLRSRSRLSARRRLRPARRARGEPRGAGRRDDRQHETGQRRGRQGGPSAHVTAPRARPCADASCGAARARRAP